MKPDRSVSFNIGPWRSELDAATFSSGLESIDRYIHDQAQRDMSSHASLIFVLTEDGDNIVRAYFTLSAIGIVFADLPKSIQRKLPRYPQIGATLLGRLGVDRTYSSELCKRFSEKPRLGELLLVDAQRKTLDGATTSVGSALMIIDVLTPSAQEERNGVKDPMNFYTQYGFLPFPNVERRLFKTTRQIESEFASAQDSF